MRRSEKRKTQGEPLDVAGSQGTTASAYTADSESSEGPGGIEVSERGKALGLGN